MPMPAFIRGAVEVPGYSCLYRSGQNEARGVFSPKGRDWSKHRKVKETAGRASPHQPTEMCSRDAVPASLPPTCSSVGTSTPLGAASRMVGGRPEPCSGLPKVRQDLGAVLFC